MATPSASASPAPVASRRAASTRARSSSASRAAVRSSASFSHSSGAAAERVDQVGGELGAQAGLAIAGLGGDPVGHQRAGRRPRAAGRGRGPHRPPARRARTAMTITSVGRHGDGDRHEHPQHEVLQLVDVADHAGQQLAVAELLEVGRRQRLDAPEGRRAQPAERAEGDVVAAEPLAVARRRTDERHRPHAGDHHAQRQDRGLLRGPADQVARQGHQSGRGQHRHDAERRGQREAPPVDVGQPDERPQLAEAGPRRGCGSQCGSVGPHVGPLTIESRPASSSTTRSGSSTSSGSWVITTMVCVPRSSVIVAATVATEAGSRCAVGSSSTSSDARRSSARASPRRWRCPADSPCPPLPIDGVEAVGQLVDERRRLRRHEPRPGSWRRRRRVGPARCWRPPCRAAASGAAAPRPGGGASRRGRRGPIDAVADQESALVGREQAEQHPPERRLAGPARSSHHQQLARRDLAGRPGRARPSSARRSAP